jgi:hypothetical protein
MAEMFHGLPLVSMPLNAVCSCAGKSFFIMTSSRRIPMILST